MFKHGINFITRSQLEEQYTKAQYREKKLQDQFRDLEYYRRDVCGQAMFHKDLMEDDRAEVRFYTNRIKESKQARYYYRKKRATAQEKYERHKRAYLKYSSLCQQAKNKLNTIKREYYTTQEKRKKLEGELKGNPHNLSYY